MKLPIDPAVIEAAVRDGDRQAADIRAALEAIAKAEAAERLSLEEISAITALADRPEVEARLFEAAAKVRRAVYGRRMILFAPLYWSNCCVNACLYCGFRQANCEVDRLVLTDEQVLAEARVLASQGYRRVLLESGEDPKSNTIDRACGIVSGLYGLNGDDGRPLIDRVNVNIAATTVEDYRRLAQAGIGTYNLFQETYHRPTYETVHPAGPKHDYLRQLTAHDRAFAGGIDDVGLGVLWGLYDWRFELLAMIAHGRHLEANFGTGPHTFSVPRIKPASGVDFQPPHPVSDQQLLRIVAILRVAVPYAGLVISTREPAWLRRRAFAIGISQTSAGSSTEVGGYSARRQPDRGAGESAAPVGQFTLEDSRGLDETVRQLIEDDFIPAFCTACEQRGRTGPAFAKVAQAWRIGRFCSVNSVLALAQYVRDGRARGFISEATAQAATDLIEREVAKSDHSVYHLLRRSLARIECGTRQARDEYI